MRRASRVGASCGRLGLLPAVGTLGSGQLGLNPLSPSLLSSITAPRRLVGVNRTGYLRENTLLSQGIVPTRELATNASDKGVSRAKPLEQWSVKEVQQWFKTSEYQEYADRFAKLTGKQLAKLSEEQFRTITADLAVGSALYNELQALRDPAVRDPFLFLQALPEMSRWTVPSDIGRIQPPTRTEFPYQKEDLLGVVKTLWELVVLPNWRAFRKSEIKDRKAWSLALIHGISGVGKTRLDLELLNLLLEYASRPEFAGDAEIQELKEYLSLGKTVVLDLRHNGSALLPQETEWPAESILGLRLACEYWFPHIAYRDVFGTVRALSQRQPHVLELFWLSSVFKAIAVHPGSPTPNDPSPRIPKLLHIAIDEIQTAFDSEVAYQGQAKEKKFEPLSLALSRALMQGITANRPFFVLGTLSGTAVRHPKEVVDPTDYSSVSVLLPHLSFEATRRVVESFWFEPRPGREVPVTGKDWLAKGVPFERLLATVGGHPRALEVLKQVLDTYDSPPESLNLDRMCKMLADLVAQKFNLDSWGKQGSGAFGLLLALSGIPVRAGLVVSSPQAAEQVTVSDLERAGLVQLRSPPKCSGDDPLWADIWELRTGKYVVMEVPFVLAQAALVALSSTLPDRELEAYVRGTTLLENFYLDPGGFEKAVLQHRVMRHNVASQFALRQGRDHIPARDLFCGTICAPAFTKLRFKPRTEQPVYVAAPTAGVWCQKADLLNEKKEIPTIIPLQDGTKIDLHRTSPYAILLSGNNPFDTMQNEQVLSDASGQGKAAMTRKAIVYTDAKFGHVGTRDVLNEKDDIAPLLLKRLQLAHKLKDFMHILVITSNKPARQRGGRPHTAQTLLRVPDDAPASQRQVPDGVDPLTCIVSASDDGLAWALSPTFSSLLTLPHDVSKPVVNEEED